MKINYLACFICVSLFANSACKASDILLEAENATFTGVEVSAGREGYSGAGFVTGYDAETDNIEFIFTASAGIYELFIGYSSPTGEKGYNFSVNGSGGSGMFPKLDSFSHVSAGKILLLEGENSIRITKGWGYFDIDYIKLSPSKTYLPSKPSQKLSDTLATQSTQKLYEFLFNFYGKKVLSGQQSLSDIEYIKNLTGQTPVISGFDLMDYSPSRINFGVNPSGIVESWINWENEKKSIITLAWHWNAPVDLINEQGKEWYSGFYSRATTFNFAEAIEDTASAKYDSIIRDIDAIAVQLKKFSDQDIPVLWRPLHEASGGWFWWGSHGAEPYKKLWEILYSRLVNYHNLHNLIWVYTSGIQEWYPGDDFVDIVSLDIYSNKGESFSGSWESIQNQFNGKKMVALSESGTMPLPENIRTFNTWWSWFAVWEGNYIRNYSKDELIKIYNDNDILTLEKLGNWRTYKPKE